MGRVSCHLLNLTKAVCKQLLTYTPAYIMNEGNLQQELKARCPIERLACTMDMDVLRTTYYGRTLSKCPSAAELRCSSGCDHNTVAWHTGRINTQQWADVLESHCRHDPTETIWVRSDDL